MSDPENKLFSGEIGFLDDILSGETFHSFRKLRIIVFGIKHIKFPKHKERKVDVEFIDENVPIPL